MQLGVDGVFVGSGIFKSADPSKRAKAMVQAVTHYKEPHILARVSEDLGEAMVSKLNIYSVAKIIILHLTLNEPFNNKLEVILSMRSTSINIGTF